MFSSESDAPAGYITMTAGDILAGAQAVIADRTKKIEAWREALPGKLAAWASGLWWGERLWYRVPSDPAKLVVWWKQFDRIWRTPPEIEGLDDCPYLPGWVTEWERKMQVLPPETKVFINVDDGAALTSWIPKRGGAA